MDLKIVYILLAVCFTSAVIFLILFIKARLAYKKILKMTWNSQKEYNGIQPADPDFPAVNPDNYADTELLINMKHLFRKEKVYLDPDLSINDLALKLNSNKTAVSKIINSNLQKNFPSLLNEYRINEAMNILADPKNDVYKMEVIGEMCGYKNRQVFHNAFKKATGVTPAHFRNINRKQANNL